jgi:acetate kinase
VTGIGGTSWYYKSGLTVFGTAANPNTAPVFGLPNDVYKQKGFSTYGSSGTPVMYVGSFTAGPAPNLTWVPINRD